MLKLNYEKIITTIYHMKDKHLLRNEVGLSDFISKRNAMSFFVVEI